MLYLYLVLLWCLVGVFPLLPCWMAEFTTASFVAYSARLASSLATVSVISRSRPSAPRSRTNISLFSTPKHYGYKT